MIELWSLLLFSSFLYSSLPNARQLVAETKVKRKIP